MKNKVIDEEESERAYKRESVLENLLERTKESLANEIYNDIIAEGVNKDKREEGIPYMGWFWRDFDFIGKDVTIGKDHDNNIGVMANNKWDYPQRQMTEEEVDRFMELIDRVIAVDYGYSDDIAYYKKQRLLELRKWVQELAIGEEEIEKFLKAEEVNPKASNKMISILKYVNFEYKAI